MTTATEGPADAPGFAPSPDLYPFASRWPDSSAGRVHYVDEGAGRPISSFRGPSTSSSRMRPATWRRRSRSASAHDELRT